MWDRRGCILKQVWTRDCVSMGYVNFIGAIVEIALPTSSHHLAGSPLIWNSSHRLGALQLRGRLLTNDEEKVYPKRIAIYVDMVSASFMARTGEAFAECIDEINPPTANASSVRVIKEGETISTYMAILLGYTFSSSFVNNCPLSWNAPLPFGCVSGKSAKCIYK